MMGACKLTENPNLLPIGRSIQGVTIGITATVAPVYLNEIAPLGWKGNFGISFQTGAISYEQKSL